MLTITINASNSNTLSIPQSELEKLSVSNGDEFELSKNESDEIVLRPKQSERRKRILDATRDIIEDRKSALLELGKGHE